MKIVQLIANLIVAQTGVTNELALETAYRTCPPDVDPEQDIPESLVQPMTQVIDKIFKDIMKKKKALH